MFVVTTLSPDFCKLQRSDMRRRASSHAAPLELATVLIGLDYCKYVAPAGAGGYAASTSRPNRLRSRACVFAGRVQRIVGRLELVAILGTLQHFTPCNVVAFLVLRTRPENSQPIGHRREIHGDKSAADLEMVMTELIH